MSNPRNKYAHIEETESLEDEIEVPVSTTHYPPILEDRISKRMSILLKICLFFIIIFLLLTVSLSFVYASKGHPGFYLLAVGLILLASISAIKLHWMKDADWDSKVRWATIAQSLAVIFLCMGLMAVMYGPNLKEQIKCGSVPELYYIGGYTTGLTDPNLQLGISSTQVYPGATSFTLATRFSEGSRYTVSVVQQPFTNDPGKPTQYCSVNNGSGTVLRSNVSTISIKCEKK